MNKEINFKQTYNLSQTIDNDPNEKVNDKYETNRYPNVLLETILDISLYKNNSIFKIDLVDQFLLPTSQNDNNNNNSNNFNINENSTIPSPLIYNEAEDILKMNEWDY